MNVFFYGFLVLQRFSMRFVLWVSRVDLWFSEIF